MILVAVKCVIDEKAEGFHIAIDTDRSVMAWPTKSGGLMIDIKNGQQITSVGVSEETAIALFEVLAGWYQEKFS